VPASLVWLVLIAGIRAIRNDADISTAQILITGGVVIVVLVLLTLLLPEKEIRDEDSVPITGGGYPVPPLDLKVPETTPRRKALKAKARSSKQEPAAVGASKDDSDA
jgi:NADH-quinone oxidoreductase subunit H